MRIRTGAIAVAVSIAAVFGVAGPAAAAAPESLTGKGTLASLDFVTTDTITCTDGSSAVRTTETSLLAEHIFFDPSGTPVIVEFESLGVDIVILDGCTGLTTEQDGLLLFGRGEFELAANARTAIVRASIVLLPRTPDTAEGLAEFDLTFTANSRLHVTVVHDRTVTPEGTTLLRTKKSLRNAAVTGTFLLDGRDLLTTAKNIDAKIGTEKLVSMTRS